MSEIRIGYIPLTDAAVLIAAAERGFAEKRGVRIVLQRESSWATMRDKLILGHVDAAHLLAPLAIATTLGLGQGGPVPLTVPFCLNLNGNAVTVSVALWREMGEPRGGLDEIRAALGRVGRKRTQEGRPLTFATVFYYSTHTLLWRALLDGTGLDPDRDIRMTVVPPPYTASALADGAIDGFSVGSPWNSVAVTAGTGRIVALGPDLLPDAPEKVIAWPEGRVAREVAEPLVAALKDAGAWCADPANHPELAALLAEPGHLGIEASLIQRTLSGRLLLGPEGPEQGDASYFRIGGDAHRPNPDLANWIYERMIEAGQVVPDDASRAVARAVYDPEIFDCA